MAHGDEIRSAFPETDRLWADETLPHIGPIIDSTILLHDLDLAGQIDS